MKIKQKLVLSYLTISLFGAIAGFLGIQNMNKVHEGFDRIADQTIPVKNELNELERSINNLIKCTYEYIFISGSENASAGIEVNKNATGTSSKSRAIKPQNKMEYAIENQLNSHNSLMRYKSLISTYFPDEKTYLSSIEESSNKIISVTKEIFALDLKKKNTKLKIFLKQKELNQGREAFAQAVRNALEHEHYELEERKLNLQLTLNSVTQEILIFISINVFLAISLGIIVSLSISVPIEKLTAFAVAVGKGNLGTRTNFYAKDEIGILADTFNQMAGDLQQYILDLQAAKENNALLATALENVTDAIEITDSEARYLYVNPAFEEITGYTKQEVLGKTPALLRSGKHDPDFYQSMIDAVYSNRIWNGALVCKCKNGTYCDLEVTLSPITNDEGLLTNIVGVKRDITQRKRAEEALREAERRWRTLLESMRLVVIGLDCLGNVEYVNPYFLKLSGYTQAEVMGKNWFENFLPPYQRLPVETCFLDILEQNLNTNFQNTILTKSGEERVIKWDNTLLRNPQGKSIGTISIGEDITERRVIERMKDEFISVVSHELRTPLAAIQGGLNLLSSKLIPAQSDKGRRIIDIAAENIDSLVLLVNDILEVERLESGKIRLSKRPCDAGDLIIKAQQLMEIMSKRAGITLQVLPRSFTFEADPDRIIQVLTNLLGNAIKFSTRGSTVWASVEQYAQEDSILFTVKDQGRGIPLENLESIFERFQQVDASDSRKMGGTGLGLAICRSIVQQHGGKLWVESIVGEGSSFMFSLPRLAMEIEKNGN
jgi:PAS domain S-box-containing protein